MKFHGKIGFVQTVETPVGSGIYLEEATEKSYFGDMLKTMRSWEKTEYANDDLNINNELSILSNPYIIERLNAVRYVVWHGTAWKVKSAELVFPRIKLTLGGVYNGIRPSGSETPETTG